MKEKAIRIADIGVQPTNDGNIVRIRAADFLDLKRKARFIEVTQAGRAESAPHGAERLR